MSIELKQITKIYGSQKAVNNLSFSAAKNEIAGFLGPNGAGKSTTMKMITGFLIPDSGTALVHGIDVAAHPLAAKKIIGYLPEGNPLYYEMYVREYLSFLSRVHRIENPAARINEVIDMTGLGPERQKKAGQLSKGYKQRLGLAAALLHDPEVLILDEPTSGLDPNQIIEIRQLIKELGKNKTVLFSSHILQEVESVCDRIIIINKGEIVANDNIRHLRTQSGEFKIVSVKFSQNPPREILENMSSVASLKKSDETWILQTNDPETVKKQLLELSLTHNWDILSLQTGSQSLEEVFRRLTGNTSAADRE